MQEHHNLTAENQRKRRILQAVRKKNDTVTQDKIIPMIIDFST